MYRRPALICATALLAGCTGAAAVPAAQQSTDPACSQALVAVRGLTTLDGRPRREVTSQATAAWGDDASIQFRCGVPALGPSTDRCQNISQVDWVISQRAGRTIFTAYGHSPTVAVSVAGLNPAGTDVILDSLAPAARAMPANGRKCL